MFCLMPLTQHLNLHALLEQTERLREVAYAELVLGIVGGPCVLDFEEEPLLVAFRIRVDFDEQIVTLNDFVFVSSLPFLAKS